MSPWNPRALGSCLGLVGLVLALVACDRHGPEVGLVRPGQAQPPSPELGKVGRLTLTQAEVEPLAGLMFELRQAQELPAEPAALADPAARQSLAIELLALADQAGGALGDQAFPRTIEDGRKRLLARLLLSHALREVEARPVTEAELQARLAEEVEEFRRSGHSSSGLFEPSRVDVVVVGAGLFPDLEEHPGLPPVSPPGSPAAAIADLRREVGDRAADHEAFLAAAARLAADHPCLRVEVLWGIPLRHDLSPLEPRLAAALAGLDGHGAVSRPLERGANRYLLRRGASRPGRGERVEDVRDALEQAIRLERRRAAAARLLTELRQRYEVQVWPERLSSAS